MADRASGTGAPPASGLHGPVPHTGGTSHNGTGESGLEILDRRFAQGEINEDEYEEKK